MHFISKFLLSVVVAGLIFTQGKREVQNDHFTMGEELTFKVKYLFFNAAEAKMNISNIVYQIGGRPTYKIDVHGRTLSIFRIFYVKDNWGTYLDTARLIPHISYRHIEEGNYRKHEQVIFDHEKGKATMNLFDRENKRITETTTHDITPNVQDIVSGFYLLRTMDLSSLKKGEAINIKGFFDKTSYNINLTFEGKERISTKVGTFDTFIFSPTMPSNKLFSGEKPVKVWITDDANRIPVRINAKLVVGSLDMEITEAKGLRHP